MGAWQAKLAGRLSSISWKRKVGILLLAAISLSAVHLLVRFEPSPTNSIHAVTPEDITVYQGFLNAANNPDGAHHVRLASSVKFPMHVVCVNSTISMQGQTSDGWGARKEDDYVWLRQTLTDRNSGSVPIPSFANSVSASIGPSTLNSRTGQSEIDIYFSLPAYNADHSMALLCVASESQRDIGDSVYVMQRRWFSWSVDKLISGGSIGVSDR